MRSRRLSSLAREFKTYCQHEATHAVLAAINGKACSAVLVSKPGFSRNLPSYESFLDELAAILHLNPSERVQVKEQAPGGIMIPRETPTPETATLVDAAFLRAPEQRERDLEWTDKSKIAVHASGDRRFYDTIVAAQPEMEEKLDLYGKPEPWRILLNDSFALAPVDAAINQVASALENKRTLLSREIYELILEAFEPFRAAACADDLVVVRHRGTPIPFLLLKASFLEAALAVASLLVQDHRLANEPVPAPLLDRHKKILQEYEETIAQEGANGFFVTLS